MPTLDDIITRIRSEAIHREFWLYIEGSAEDLKLHTPADLGIPKFDEETDEESDPTGFVERGLNVTIDAETVKQSIEWADKLAGVADNSAAARIIRYYIRFDGWPERLDAPDPDSPEVSNLRFYKQFVESLGDERPEVICRKDDCERGAIELSAFCRRHHFENIYRSVPYPFND
jgi:hypothetical protein